ncbi:MAG: PadR family transcriptional regulator [Solirubrobacteraceae bacterium]|nr:PadR family transcriptional regulator [Solirubrobacteraceae bacterium]
MSSTPEPSLPTSGPPAPAKALLSPVEVVVLGLVRAAGSATPYDLKAGVGGSLGYFWEFPHSQLYAAPDKLVERGLLRMEQESGGRRRKSYSGTPAGEAALDAWLADPPTELPEYRIPALLGIFFGADPRAMAEQMLPRHQARMAEYERLMEAGAKMPADAPQGPLQALRAGMLAERAWLDYYEGLLAE